MKKYIFVFVIGSLLFLHNSCTKFQAPSIDLTIVSMEEDGLIHCKGKITDNGGNKFINEMGFLFSFKPMPSYKGQEVETVMVYEDLETTDFDYIKRGIIPDTVYYIRAYAITNAGTGYSNMKILDTHTSEENSGGEGGK